MAPVTSPEVAIVPRETTIERSRGFVRPMRKVTEAFRSIRRGARFSQVRSDRASLTADRSSLSPRLATVVLIAIVSLAAIVGSAWAYRMPFLQGTDEQAHADYAFALFDGRHGSAGALKKPADHVTAQVRFLERESNFWALRFYEDSRVPSGYGSRRFFRDVDASAPRGNELHFTPRSAYPYVAFSYPPGYYAVSALVMHLAAHASADSLSASFFAARELGVAMLIVALIFTYGTMIELRYPRFVALIVTGIIGSLPLSSWVCSYIQPDSMVFALVSIALYATARIKGRDKVGGSVVLLQAVLCICILVKVHYGIVLAFACDMVVVGTLGVHRRMKRETLLLLLALAIVPVVAFDVATAYTPIGAIAIPAQFTQPKLAAFSFDSLLRTLERLIFAVVDMYAGGNAFRSYWLEFGDNLTSSIRPASLATAVTFGLTMVSLGILSGVGVAQVRIWQRLKRIFWARRQSVVRLVLRDVFLNLYVVWVAFLLAVYVMSDGAVYLEGRYALPILLPTIVIAVTKFPYVVARRQRIAVARIVLIAWAGFAAIMSPIAMAAMNSRYYSNDGIGADRTGAAVVVVESLVIGHSVVEGVRTVVARTRDSLRIKILAGSKDPSRDVDGIAVSIDGGASRLVRVPVRVGTFDGVLFKRYEVTIPSDDLKRDRVSIEIRGLIDNVARGYDVVNVVRAR